MNCSMKAIPIKKFIKICIIIGMILIIVLAKTTIINNSSEGVQEGEVSNETSECWMSPLNPFDPSLTGRIGNPRQIHCGQKPLLTNTERTKEGYVLSINGSAKTQYISPDQRLLCCYSYFRRKITALGEYYDPISDFKYEMDRCHTFEDRVLLEPEEDFIMVECHATNSDGVKESFVYRMMHSVVPLKREVLKRIQKRKRSDDRLNVIMIVFDSYSQNNLYRTMPKTIQFLEKSGFVNFRLYNKVGLNTFPNGVAMMTGLSPALLKGTCWGGDGKKLDDCPFVWKDFQNHGYVTAFNDEGSCLGSKTYLGAFVKQPTDHYLHTLFSAGENYRVVRYYENSPFCFGTTSTTDHIYRHILEYLTVYENYLSFSVTWLSNFSHDLDNEGALMDERTVKFFEDVISHPVYNKSLVLFLSDHGRRYGPIAETLIGWYEDRLPFLYVSVPDWFKMKHSQMFQNLVKNSEKLVSTYNIYVTLKDVLYRGANLSLPKSNVSLGCPKCGGLFSDNVGGATCSDLGIGDVFCACKEFKNKQITNEDKKVAEMSVRYIRKTIAKKSISGTCAELHLHEVISASHEVAPKNKNKTSDQTIGLVVFETVPGNALFKAHVVYKRNLNVKIEKIFRVNAYGSTSKCVDDPQLKLYCFCVKQN